METLNFELFLWIWGLLLYLVDEIVWGIDKVVLIYGLWEVCLNWLNVIQLFHKFGFCTVCLLRKCGIGNATVCCWDRKYWILNIYCKFCNFLLNGSRWILQVSLNYEFFALFRYWENLGYEVFFFWINFGSWDLYLNESNRTNIVRVIIMVNKNITDLAFF